jgi:hypothetical protein
LDKGIELPLALQRPYEGSPQAVRLILPTSPTFFSFTHYTQNLYHAKRTPSLPFLPKSLFPDKSFPLHPPLLYLGFELTNDKVMPVATRRGYVAPTDPQVLLYHSGGGTKEVMIRHHAEKWIAAKLKKLTGMDIRRVHTFGLKDRKSCLIAFGHNWQRYKHIEPKHWTMICKFIGEIPQAGWYLDPDNSLWHATAD